MDDRSGPVGPELGMAHVMARILFRLIVLVSFALASSQPFWTVLTTLFVVAANLCVIIAALRREALLGPALSHWDEAAFYALLSWGVAMLIAAMPSA